MATILDGYKLVTEALKSTSVRFVIHRHHPRSGSEHYDIRFLDPKDPKLLHSFAAPKDFPKTMKTKTILAKTRDHDPRWLTLKSYRLDEADTGLVSIKIATQKYFELNFKGKLISGTYKLFKIKNSRRGDRWLLVKSK